MKARSVLASLLVACSLLSNAQDSPTYPAWVVQLPWPGSGWTVGEYLFYQLGNPTETPSVRDLLEAIADAWSPSDVSSVLSVTNTLDSLLGAVLGLSQVTNNADLRQIRDYLSGAYESLVSDISGSLDSSVNYLGSVDYEVSAIRSLLERSDLDSVMEVTSNQLASVLGILRNEENPIEVDIRTGGVAFDILEQILHAIQDGSSSGAGIVDGVTNMVNQGVNVPVDVKNFDSSGSSLDVVLSAFASDLSERDWNTLVQNFDGDGSDWLTAFESSVLMRSISNSLASLSPSQRFLATAEVATASTVETVVTNNFEYSADMVAASNSAANFKFDFRGEHSDPENPWQPAPIYNTMQSAGRFFAKPDPATTSDVLLMGSNNPNNRRAGPRLVPLPEIRFDLEEVLLSTNEYYNMRNIFNLLWRVLGGAAQLMLLGSFVHWYATRQKG